MWPTTSCEPASMLVLVVPLLVPLVVPLVVPLPAPHFSGTKSETCIEYECSHCFGPLLQVDT